MPKFATGKNSYAISDRSGQRYRYRDMRKEWNGLLVGKDEYEPKHPQLYPYPPVTDPQALKNARPDRVEPMDVPVGGGGFPDRGVDTHLVSSVGFVTVVTT
jgi:hypothetical protein